MFGEILTAKLPGSGVGPGKTREINEEMMSHFSSPEVHVRPSRCQGERNFKVQCRTIALLGAWVHARLGAQYAIAHPDEKETAAGNGSCKLRPSPRFDTLDTLISLSDPTATCIYTTKVFGSCEFRTAMSSFVRPLARS